MRHAVLLLALFACGPAPNLGQETDAAVAPQPRHGLRVANWNIEWFGAPDRGPADEQLQLANARAVIEAADAELWVVAEISAPEAFEALVAQLPGRAGLLASDPEVDQGSRYYTRDEQRVGLIYDPEHVEVRSAKLILTELAYDFAGRPPLAVEVHLELPEGSMELTVIAVHLKAFGDQDSHDRRQHSAAALAAYLSGLPRDRAVLVAGDWNDALEGSTTAGEDSPFGELLDAPDLRFWTADLAAAGVVSYAGGRHFLDHQLANRALDALGVPHSTRLVEVDEIVPDFAATTSDHYPVISELDLHRALSINEILANEPGRNRSLEMIELVNTSCVRLRLDGLLLGADAGPHPDLAGLEIGEGAAIAIRSRRGLGLGNTGGTVSLREAGGEPLEQVRYPASLSALDGVSMNRVPDGSRSLAWRLHRSLSGTDSSPGRRSDGRAFACR